MMIRTIEQVYASTIITILPLYLCTKEDASDTIWKIYWLLECFSKVMFVALCQCVCVCVFAHYNEIPYWLCGILCARINFMEFFNIEPLGWYSTLFVCKQNSHVNATVTVFYCNIDICFRRIQKLYFVCSQKYLCQTLVQMNIFNGIHDAAIFHYLLIWHYCWCNKSSCIIIIKTKLRFSVWISIEIARTLMMCSVCSFSKGAFLRHQ